jgi:hypothetical protein
MVEHGRASPRATGRVPRLELMLARNNAVWYQLLDLWALTTR